MPSKDTGERLSNQVAALRTADEDARHIAFCLVELTRNAVVHSAVNVGGLTPNFELCVRAGLRAESEAAGVTGNSSIDT